VRKSADNEPEHRQSVNLKINSTLILGLALAFAAQANPLTFSGFTGTFPYVENGLAVSASQTPAGAWIATGANTLGAVAHLNSPAATIPGAPGTINITGGLFYFSSVDFSCGPVAGEILGPVSFAYSITGSLHGATVFNTTATLASLSAYGPALWSTVGGDPSVMLDSLAITLRTTSSGGVDATGYALRNLELARVPDTAATAALLGVSLGALARWRQSARSQRRK
jgi:hypothetical protein